jgi:hypothetical protein
MSVVLYWYLIFGGSGLKYEVLRSEHEYATESGCRQHMESLAIELSSHSIRVSCRMKCYGPELDCKKAKNKYLTNAR